MHNSVTDFSLLVEQVKEEFYEACKEYDTHPTLEHSLCVLLEEVDELKAEIYKKPSARSVQDIQVEAVQVAAMALRLLHDMAYTAELSRAKDKEEENA